MTNKKNAQQSQTQAKNAETKRTKKPEKEDKDGWGCVLQDLRRRGATQMDLIVTDGHEGLLSAVSALFTATPRQRCLVHKQRNVMNAIPKREQEAIATELAGIWKHPTKEQALTELA